MEIADRVRENLYLAVLSVGFGLFCFGEGIDNVYKDDILKIAHWLKPAQRYFLQNFRPEKTIDPKFEKIKPYPQEYLLEIRNAIAPFFEICQIR